MTNSLKIEYVVRWAEFDAEDERTGSIEFELMSNQELGELSSHLVEPGPYIHSGTYRSVLFDSEEGAKAFANQVMERYPEDKIKWLAYLEIDRRQTETICKLK